eukprot:scaffold34597_cov177-Amphora_coffeaeformis.AAC.15
MTKDERCLSMESFAYTVKTGTALRRGRQHRLHSTKVQDIIRQDSKSKKRINEKNSHQRRHDVMMTTNGLPKKTVNRRAATLPASPRGISVEQSRTLCHNTFHYIFVLVTRLVVAVTFLKMKHSPAQVLDRMRYEKKVWCVWYECFSRITKWHWTSINKEIDPISSDMKVANSSRPT